MKKVSSKIEEKKVIIPDKPKVIPQLHSRVKRFIVCAYSKEPPTLVPSTINLRVEMDSLISTEECVRWVRNHGKEGVVYVVLQVKGAYKAIQVIKKRVSQINTNLSSMGK